MGTSPTTPASTSTAEPTSSPPAARAIGGSPLPSSAESTKYVAAPTMAPSAQRTPTRLTSAPESRSRTSTRPASATTAPAIVSRPGARPCRSQSQVITATGAVYSISSATPTCMWATA